MKIAVAVTGASGSIYAKQLLQQLQAYKQQVQEVSIVYSDNAPTVWQYELGDDSYKHFPFKVFAKNNFISYKKLLSCLNKLVWNMKKCH